MRASPMGWNSSGIWPTRWPCPLPPAPAADVQHDAYIHGLEFLRWRASTMAAFSAPRSCGGCPARWRDPQTGAPAADGQHYGRVLCLRLLQEALLEVWLREVLLGASWKCCSCGESCFCWKGGSWKYCRWPYSCCVAVRLLQLSCNILAASLSARRRRRADSGPSPGTDTSRGSGCGKPLHPPVPARCRPPEEDVGRA